MQLIEILLIVLMLLAIIGLTIYFTLLIHEMSGKRVSPPAVSPKEAAEAASKRVFSVMGLGRDVFAPEDKYGEINVSWTEEEALAYETDFPIQTALESFYEIGPSGEDETGVSASALVVTEKLSSPSSVSAEETQEIFRTIVRLEGTAIHDKMKAFINQAEDLALRFSTIAKDSTLIETAIPEDLQRYLR